MGCAARVVLYASDAAAARAAARAAFSRMKTLEHALSDYDPESESERLGALSGAGAWHEVSHDLFDMLSAARWMAARSNGAFDPTCGALTRLWRSARKSGMPPPAEAARAALATVSWRSLELEATTHRVRMALAGQRLDFGGIAKGHAASEAARVLRTAGFRAHCVAIEGDMTLGAAPPGELGWRVALDPVAGQPELQRALVLSHCALSTSGDSFQNMVVAGTRRSHILDPRTGQPLEQPVAVSVIAQEGAMADAAATALCVLPADRRAALVRKLGIAARVLQATPSATCEALFGPWPTADT